MDIILYYNSSDNKAINKEIVEGATISGTLRNDTSIISPIIALENAEVFKYNYAYIPSFERYYYITDIKSLRNNLWEVYMKVDVLMSHKQAILSNESIISHSESNANNYIPSDVWRNDVRQNTEIINFPNGFNEEALFVLITAGATI